METLDLTVNNRKSSSSTLSDASSCGTSRSTSAEQKKRKDSPKYHSAMRNRLRKDGSVLRSKSFQEQDVRKTTNPRFHILRRNPQSDLSEFQLSKTISHHNIQITIEDTDANEQPINHKSLRPRKKTAHCECTSNNSSDLKIRSGHILGRIFRRMRKLSMAWRKSKNKSRTRGEFKFKSFRLVSSN